MYTLQHDKGILYTVLILHSTYRFLCFFLPCRACLSHLSIFSHNFSSFSGAENTTGTMCFSASLFIRWLTLCMYMELPHVWFSPFDSQLFFCHTADSSGGPPRQSQGASSDKTLIPVFLPGTWNSRSSREDGTWNTFFTVFLIKRCWLRFERQARPAVWSNL